MKAIGHHRMIPTIDASPSFVSAWIRTISIALLLGSSAPAVEVTTRIDENNGSLDPGLGTGTSLREAIIHSPAGTTITFASNLNRRTITLSLGQLSINKNLIIDASSLPERVSVSGNNASRIFEIQEATVNLTGINIVSGATIDDGGGILTTGTLTLNDCEISANRADEGGGIYNYTALILNHCRLFDNTAVLWGGGIENTFGSITMTHCQVFANSAPDIGGGIDNNEGTITLTACTLTGNSAEYGGGILNSEGTVTLTSCTFSGNHADKSGGGIYNAGTGSGMTVTSCTFTGNTASDRGAAAANDGTLTMDACTISENQTANGHGALRNSLLGTLTLKNSIVAGNANSSGGTTDPNLDGSITTPLGVNFTSGAPLLAPLGNHGGPTQTLPPLPGSPVIDAGSANTLSTDQRGLTRVLGTAVDIGAVESGNTLPTVTINTLVDENDGIAVGGVSLRDAVNEAPAGSTIHFTNSLNGGKIPLNPGELVLAANLDIDASSLPAGIIVSAGSDSRVFRVRPGTHVVITGLSLSDAYFDFFTPATDGGAIFNAGYLTLRACDLNENYTEEGSGGAVFSNRQLTVDDCRLSGNFASFGGGIYNQGTATVRRSEFSGNDVWDAGGGIFNRGQLDTADCTIGNNSAQAGGGIANLGPGAMTVTASTLHHNSASTIGGGVDTYEGGISTIINCTLTKNRSNGGGIGIESGTVTVRASTLTENEGIEYGGGVFNEGGSLSLRNTIVAKNSTGDFGPDVFGPLNSQSGVNLVSSTAGITGTFSGLVGDPRLAPLGNYGGPTATMPPLPGSPVIEAAILVNGDPRFDQSGAVRPRGPLPDIGAMEAVAFSTLALVDSDFDGIPDLLETAYPQFTVGVNDSALDTDGDGSTDAKELANMTDPLDESDYLRITAFAKAPGFDAVTRPIFSVSFNTFPGLSYSLEADQNLDFTGPDHTQPVAPFVATAYFANFEVILHPGRDFLRARRE